VQTVTDDGCTCDCIRHRDDGTGDNRMLRSRKLQTLAQQEISLKNLRSLFRLLDDDGSGEVSAHEIRRGLLLLGFPEAKDPVALSRVVSDIDEDNTV
jgi:hypothetical protein